MRELRRVLLAQFTERSDLLKARSSMLALQHLLRSVPVAGGDELVARLDQLRAGAHELAELRLLAAVRIGELELRAEEQAEVERLLGLAGSAPRSRLGLPPDAADAELLAAAVSTLSQMATAGREPDVVAGDRGSKQGRRAHLRGPDR